MAPGRRSTPSPCSRVRFWSELKRRHVVKVALGYAIVGLGVGEGAQIFLPGTGAPEWVQPVILVLIVLGFPVALVLAWAYDMTPEGVVRTGAEASSAGTAAVAEAPPVAEEHQAVDQAQERAVGAHYPRTPRHPQPTAARSRSFP